MTKILGLLPDPPRRVPDVEDDFTHGPRADLWIPAYLPHWTTPDRSAARYDASADGLRLRIDADQLDWRTEDAPLRVSNLQSGNYSGELGSRRGTHRHREDGLVVRTPGPTTLLWAPSAASPATPPAGTRPSAVPPAGPLRDRSASG